MATTVRGLVAVFLVVLTAQAFAPETAGGSDPVIPGTTAIEGEDREQQPGPASNEGGDLEEDLISGQRSLFATMPGRGKALRTAETVDSIPIAQWNRSRKNIQRDMKSVDDSVRRMRTSVNSIRTTGRLFRR